MKKQNVFAILLSIFIICLSVFIYVKNTEPYYKAFDNPQTSDVKVEEEIVNESTSVITSSKNSRIYKTYNVDEYIGVYISPSLGITFEYVYDPEESDSVVIKENENVITVNDSTKITVFEKDPNLSLKQAIEQNILKGYDPSKCWVVTNTINNPNLNNFETAQIEFPEVKDLNSPWWENAKDCPEGLTTINGVSYYIYDPEVPEKFAFVDKGQAVSAYAPSEYENKDFSYTIKFMSPIEAKINSFVEDGIVDQYFLSPNKKHVFLSVYLKNGQRYSLYNLETGKSILPDEDYNGYYVYNLWEINDQNLVWYKDYLFIASGFSSHGAEGFPGIVKVDLNTDTSEIIVDFTNECPFSSEDYVAHCIDSYKFEIKSIQENKLTYIESFNNENEEFSKYNYSIEKIISF